MANLQESPFASFFDTNRTPSLQECSDIRSFIRPSQDELSDLNKEISRLQSLIDNLKLRRGPLEEFVSQHLNITSLIRRLPSEVLSQIFIACLPTAHYPVHDLTQAPLLFTTISQRFRDVAISTPDLWSSIHVTLPSYDEPNRLSKEEYGALVSRRQKGVLLWLARSSNLPLSFSLVIKASVHSDGGLCQVLDATKFMAVLTERHRRWKEIRLRVPRDVEGQLFGQFAEEEFPLLETVQIDTHAPSQRGLSMGNQSEDEALARLKNVLQHTRILRNLYLHAPISVTHSLEYRDLTHLRVMSSVNVSRRLEDDLPLLSMGIPHLQSLAFASTYLLGFHPINRSNTVALFPKLRDLELYLELVYMPLHVTPDQDDPTAVVSRFFDAIQTPLLERLSIEIHGNEEFDAQSRFWFAAAPFSSLISQASEGQTLKELSLEAPITFEALLGCLDGLTDKLESLEIGEPHQSGPKPSYAGIVKYLTPENGDPPSLPQLRRLALKKWTSVGARQDVIQLAYKRSKLLTSSGCVPLEVLRVEFAPSCRLKSSDLSDGYDVEAEDISAAHPRRTSCRLMSQQIKDMKTAGTDVILWFPLPVTETVKELAIDNPCAGVYCSTESFLAMAREYYQGSS
ncbi:hypothetical protein PQX77_010846 [Marasmius sp. AFHP31]|nr:hypothetical protein PQX77_010846 [Marasmius sp. AFHP31]